MKKLGLVLGSGGARGVAHIGFLKALEDAGIKPDYISGCSMGAIVGACYATGMDADTMMHEVSQLGVTDILDPSINPIMDGAVFRAKRMKRKLKEYLKDYTFKDLKLPFCCVATNMITGETQTFDGDHIVLDCVTASATIPGVFKPVEIDGALFLDGGLKCRLPIQQVRDMGADVVVVLDVLGDVYPEEKRRSLLTVLFRAFDIMDAELSKYQVAEMQPDLYLAPRMEGVKMYRLNAFEQSYQEGYDIGKSHTDKIKELLNGKTK